MDLFDLVSDLNKDAMKVKENKDRAKERVTENGNKKASERRLKVKDKEQKKVNNDEVLHSGMYRLKLLSFRQISNAAQCRQTSSNLCKNIIQHCVSFVTCKKCSL